MVMTWVSRRRCIGKLQIFLLGIVVLFGCYFGCWSSTFGSGYGGSLVSTSIISLAYLGLTSCITTINSVIPFAGGAYGLSRCLLGFYPGFIVGGCETLHYIVFVTLFTIHFSNATKNSFSIPDKYEPVIWFFAILVSTLLNMSMSNKLFHAIIGIIACTTIVFLLIFLFGSLKSVNFSTFALDYYPIQSLDALHSMGHTMSIEAGQDFELCTMTRTMAEPKWFVGGHEEFLGQFHWPMMFFIGIEVISLAGNESKTPMKDIPRTQMILIVLAIIASLSIITVTASLSPGAQCISYAMGPLNIGFQIMFNTTSKWTHLIAILPLYGSLLVFHWALFRQLKALIDSNFLPGVPCLANKTLREARVFVGTAGFCFGLCFFGVQFMLLRLGLLCALVAYISQCLAYMYLWNAGALHNFRFNSVRYVAAIFALCVWLTTLITIGVYQDDHHVTIIIFSCGFLALSIYYYGYGKMMQTLSPDEKKYLYPMHVINFAIRNDSHLNISQIFNMNQELVDMSSFSESVNQFINNNNHNNNENMRQGRSQFIRSNIECLLPAGDRKIVQDVMRKDEEVERVRMFQEDHRLQVRQSQRHLILDMDLTHPMHDDRNRSITDPLARTKAETAGCRNRDLNAENDANKILGMNSEDLKKCMFTSPRMQLTSEDYMLSSAGTKFQDLRRQMLNFDINTSSRLEDLEAGNCSPVIDKLDRPLDCVSKKKPSAKSQPTVRPAIVFAIENDMHHYHVPSIHQLRGIFDSKTTMSGSLSISSSTSGLGPGPSPIVVSGGAGNVSASAHGPGGPFPHFSGREIFGFIGKEKERERERLEDMD